MKNSSSTKAVVKNTQARKPGLRRSQTNSKAPTTRSSNKTKSSTANAQIAQIMLREQLMSTLTCLIEENNWTQAAVGKILNVPQSRISDLMRAKTSKFTIDKLIFWLFSLNKQVTITVHDTTNGAFWSPTNPTESVEHLTRAIKLEPDNGVHYQNRGDAYVSLNKFDLAIGDYTRSIELRPDASGPRIQRVNAYRKTGQHKAALKECNDLIQFFGLGFGSRASLMQELELFDKALEDYNKAIELEPQTPGPYWNRATLYEQLGDIEHALADYNMVRKLSSDSSFATQAIERLQQNAR